MSYLKKFRLTLTTVGPVFIGSGEKRTSKEYWQTPSLAYFPDMGKLYADMLAHGKARAFEGFMLGGSTGGGRRDQQIKGAKRLNEFLQEQGWERPDKDAWGGYAVRLGDLTASKDRFDPRTQRVVPGQAARLNDIASFIKDGFGDPYVPGSSLKGMIRSLIAEYVILEQEETPRKAPSAPGANNSASALEARLFRTLGRNQGKQDDAVNDVMQAVRVADSVPLRLGDLVVAQKIDVNTKDAPAGLPLFRECVKPGVSLNFDVVVDSSVGGQVGGYGIDRVVASLRDVAARVYRQRFVPFVDKFAPAEIEGLAVHPQGAYVYLGGGAGYRSKTVVNDQKVMSEILDKQFNRGGRPVPHVRKTETTGVSPLVLKLTRLDGTYFEMGKCKLEIEPVS
jgi:CRISPR type III-A-associated RAMP protein Csm5